MATPSQYLVLDIETIPDTSIWKCPATPEGSPAPFPPPYAHQVIVVGCMLLDAHYRLVSLDLMPASQQAPTSAALECGESEILSSFSAFVQEHSPMLVSYNGRRFDLPVLALRSLRCGVPMPWYYKDREIRQRYSEEGHIDLCDWLADHGASRASSLDAMARLIGLPGKIGIDGSEVHSLYQRGRINEIRNYCLSDVAQTAFLFLRFRLLQGALDSGAYRIAVQGLTESLAADDRLRDLTAAIDSSRLLSAA